MMIFNHIHKQIPYGLKSWGLLLILTLGSFVYAQAQLVIGGNIYGGGDMAPVGGSTEVTVISGDVEGSLFGGARMANVGGNALVNIDGAATASDGKEFVQNYILIDRVYGGNDISGTIGTDPERFNDITISAQNPNGVLLHPEDDGVDATWNAFIHISDGGSTNGNSNKPIYIGQMYGGGNGDYDYATSTSPYYGMTRPEIDKTFVDLHGGSIVYAYGGGNNATVRKNTVICLKNSSSVVNSIIDSRLIGDPINSTIGQNGELLTPDRFRIKMGVNTGFVSITGEDPSSSSYQIGRMFGGNNKAEMAIRPTWHLEKGLVRNLYSGGNQGMMSSPEGLLLLIDPENNDDLTIENVYGGCRMADVRPLQFNSDGTHVIQKGNVVDVDVIKLVGEGYEFPAGLSARVLVKGGLIHNVYGGNDVTGQVYGGNAVGIHSSITGSVYGGGNGSYPYTDNIELVGNDIYGDLFYQIPQGKTSVEAMRDYRPDAEQVSIHVLGTQAKPTIIGGAIYCGGNSATLDRPTGKTSGGAPLIELKVGSYVYADKVFMGNNGENMITNEILTRYNGSVDRTTGLVSSAQDAVDFSSVNLRDPQEFATYMEGAALKHIPSVTFDKEDDGYSYQYEPYTTYFGSFYCGGNVGSMTYSGTNHMDLEAEFVIYDKFVGGCNNSNVPMTPLNAYYEGGILGAPNETDFTGDRLILDFHGPKFEPKRWNDAGDALIWNTAKWSNEQNDFVPIGTDDPNDDEERRLLGGNIYGGCYSSGHINGNVKINIDKDLIVRSEVFDYSGEGGNSNSHVILQNQGEDVMVVAMTVFGAGMGDKTEIWGSTEVNLKDCYAFQLFGGGEEGIVGKGETGVTPEFDVEGYPIKSYAYDAKYSTTVNLRGSNAGYSEDESGPVLAETQYIYGAGNEGDVCGDSYVYLGNGRIYDAFGGASNANILGHTEVYVGKQKKTDGSFEHGFPWVSDMVFGGNDFGGRISVEQTADMSSVTNRTVSNPDLLQNVSTFVSYLQGRVDSIYAGGYGNYDYRDDQYNDYVYTSSDVLPDGVVLGDPKDGFSYPYMFGSSFLYFQPIDNARNNVNYLMGGSEGYPGYADFNNTMQEKSYVLIDDINTSAANKDVFLNTDIFGGGSFAGMGYIDFQVDNEGNEHRTLYPGAGRTTVDLFAGRFNNVYAGCNHEGLVGFSRVYVPEESTISVNNIFGGGRGYSQEDIDAIIDNTSFANQAEREALIATLKQIYCDHYITLVDYRGANATVEEGIYAGNNNRRMAFDTYLNITVPVRDSKGNLITVFGAGYGDETVSGRTDVFLQNGAQVNQVYGGGRDGYVMNYPSLTTWLTLQFGGDMEALMKYASYLNGFHSYIEGIEDPITHDYISPEHVINLPQDVLDGLGLAKYIDDGRNLANPDAYHNTNVHILAGAKVVGNPREGGGTSNGYAYGGGLGGNAQVSGSTYIELKGGYVEKDIYAGGQGGPVINKYGLYKDENDHSKGYLFTASSNVYIEGGQVRNVYGGGYQGNVGLHEGTIAQDYASDIPGITNVIIGKLDDGTEQLSNTNGIPAITRNLYAGGEGGSVYGTSHLTINNGYIGYLYDGTLTDNPETEIDERYVENTHEYGPDDENLKGHGNAFGGGYVASSYVDNSEILMLGGYLRGSLYGGGEVGPIGRGTKLNVPTPAFAVRNGDATIYRAGHTHISMFNGHVLHNVFGGGRGKDSWGGDGWQPELETDLSSKGNVFGQTEVYIYGGEIGTDKNMAQGYGNVFGGCDEGYVYSAYLDNDGNTKAGTKNGSRFDDGNEGYYYKTDGVTMTEDCRVLVEPWLQVKDQNGIDYQNVTYAKGDYIPTDYLNTLPKKQKVAGQWQWTGDWNKVDAGAVDGQGNVLSERGVIIHNAVFAGGNIASGSNHMNVNATTVYGNATASINDVYHRDLITIGTGHTGGLYGDGNLTFVDGYRELNITNYGTDYYNIDSEITIDVYNTKLSPRERAYYELRYKCVKNCIDKEGTQYRIEEGDRKASTITADQLTTLFVKQEGDNFVSVMDGGNPIMVQTQDGKWVPNTAAGSTYWVENGVCSRYAGRIMNTIQRADFCGVFGSRMVMQGAQDRVPETVDYTNYTINRVREVSLNKNVSIIDDDYATYTSGDHIGEYIDENAAMHGNYFGIYSVVNYLGALTSDVDFNEAVRVSDNEDELTYHSPINIMVGEQTVTYNYGDEGATYYNWKQAHSRDNTRNNGNSHNQVALASGVYLELVTEKSTGAEFDQKDWGLITGVVELDLINVATGIGGGFVYARNEHGERRKDESNRQITLSSLNANAISNKMFTYSTDDQYRHGWQSSGNFVHSTQTIIDDCYNIGGRYLSTNFVPAHYWFIKGQVYVYDQYISAFTGSSNAYSEKVDLPLTLTAASHGEMKLLDVQKNYYALYANTGSAKTKLLPDQKLVINDVTYYLNDPINYWDWSLLSASEKELFEPETYTNSVAVRINGGDLYKAGTYVMTQDEYNNLPSGNVYTDADGEVILDADKQTAGKDYIFRLSNNMDHDGGYILTYQVNNPGMWDQWYTPISVNGGDKKSTQEFENVINKQDYYDGPTYRPTQNGIFGQQSYKLSDIIDESVVTTYNATPAAARENLTGQASFERAYITTAYVDANMIDPDDPTQTREMHLQKGAKLARSEYSNEEWTNKLEGNAAMANICTNTIKISDSEYIVAYSLITDAEKNTYLSGVNADIDQILDATTFTTVRKEQIKDGQELTPAEEMELGEDNTNLLKSFVSLKQDINSYVVPAYYCTTPGLYGGDYYSTDNNYRALNAWSSMSADDRNQFRYNYDALDLLIDPAYSRKAGEKFQYDGYGFTTEDQAKTNPAGYSLPISLDYTAVFTGSYTNELGAEVALENVQYKYSGESTVTINLNDELTPAEFEAIPNEKRHFTRFSITEGNKESSDNKYRVYVVNTSFVDRNSPFAAGQTISVDDYNKLPSEYQSNITVFEFESIPANNTFYYCREPYTIGMNGDKTYDGEIGHRVVAAIASTGVNSQKETVTINQNDAIEIGNEVPKGFVITKDDYDLLTNMQLGFSIHGIAPKEYSTLYVSRNSDIRDLSRERIITVVYQYDYEESNESGSNITAMSERHVVNIHIQFKSGIPTVEDITKPATILPGSSLTLATPISTPGAYEILSSGWELFEKESYAENHTNGIEYTPMSDELYWYQDGYYLAYYAKTYLGKTYSNHVPVSVANYHDLKKVMDDMEHHLYVDNVRPDQRDSKIYINNYTGNKNGLDIFKEFFNLTLSTTGFDGHAPLDSHVRGGNDLEFILRTDIDNTGKTWTSIGDANNCFGGNLHGDGYTIKGLTSSLFANLCGNVYNLGVTGTFNGAGIADTGDGYVENSWISTSSTALKSAKPIIGIPTGNGIQIVNSYYMEEDDAVNKYPEHTGTGNVAIRKNAQAFYNGEVAYNLNGFYLNKRYYDGNHQSTGKQYYYLTRNADGTVSDELSQAYYPDSYAIYPISGTHQYGYVEDRYADGDYRYAAGIVPTWTDSRERTVTEQSNTSTVYAPIWPTDYQYFGQRLTYGYDQTNVHQDNPSHFNGSSNRVYRAPAYFGNSQMDKAHFNADAVLPTAARNDTTRLAYPGLTAIDFTGYGDNSLTNGSSQDSYFYPVLDFNGLTGLRTNGQTQNLLAYSDAADAATTAVISEYFREPDYFKYANDPVQTNTPNEYNSILEILDEDMVNIHGHHVLLTTDGNNSVYQAAGDHFLVDLQDFNAPIEYNMGADNIMWYQRTPGVYVQDAGTGWESISLPFTVKTVTTSQKGWITHFYQGSNVGHEYWLRTPDKMDETDNSKVLFKSIAKVSDSEAAEGIKGVNLTYTNTFLWDYYYNNRNNGNDSKRRKDKNDDTYQDYYSSEIEHDNYPYAQAAQPYLIGFPGVRYYEFDMSGEFIPRTAADNTPARLDKQIITFVSAQGINIGVSDTDYENAATVQNGNYKFKPTYQARELDGPTTWRINADGTKFQNVDNGNVTTVAFRPYFVAANSGNGVQRRAATRADAGATALYIGYVEEMMPLDDMVADRGLNIYGQDMSIWIESTLETPATVTVTTVAGSNLGKFTIQPGTRIQIPVGNRGIYIVNQKKVAVAK